ncbi:MAG TPA: flavodoxin [Bacteroidales bacterium]|nr:flavodoxin [Bacteroidales bacterium]
MESTAAIYYRTMTGNTREIALRISSLFGERVKGCYDVAKVGFPDWKNHDILLFGTCTWDIGQLPAGWEKLESLLNDPFIRSKKIALFGLGDQGSYPDTFVDGLGMLYHSFRKAGCTIYGRWPADGYTFALSKALENTTFAGLVLDENQQPELTEIRMNLWVQQLKKEMNLSEGG